MSEVLIVFRKFVAKRPGTRDLGADPTGGMVWTRSTIAMAPFALLSHRLCALTPATAFVCRCESHRPSPTRTRWLWRRVQYRLNERSNEIWSSSGRRGNCRSSTWELRVYVWLCFRLRTRLQHGRWSDLFGLYKLFTIRSLPRWDRAFSPPMKPATITLSPGLLVRRCLLRACRRFSSCSVDPLLFSRPILGLA